MITLKELYEGLKEVSEKYPDYRVIGSMNRYFSGGSEFVLYTENENRNQIEFRFPYEE